MVAEITGLAFLTPILVFVFAFLLVFAILKKTNLLGHNIIAGIVSGIVAFMFALVVEIRNFVGELMPWFIVIFVIGFFALLLLGFFGLKPENLKVVGWVLFGFFILAVVVLLFQNFLGGITGFLTVDNHGDKFYESDFYDKSFYNHDKNCDRYWGDGYRSYSDCLNDEYRDYRHDSKYYDSYSYKGVDNEAAFNLMRLKNWLFQEEVAGAILLIIITIVVVAVIK